MTYIFTFVLIVLSVAFFLMLKRYLILRFNNHQLQKNYNCLSASFQNLQMEYKKALQEKTAMEPIVHLVQQSPNAIMIMDKEGNVLSVNKGFELMYEYSYHEFIAARGNNYHRTSFSPKVIERIQYIMETKMPYKYEALNITKSGRELWTQTALVPILDQQRNVDGMVTIDTDIHKRVVASDKLIEKMESINLKIDSMSRQFNFLEAETRSLFDSINQLQDLIKQTDQIIKFIKEVSDKTKILGINASIEANIAGPYGRGFRVVANEIVDISNKTVLAVTKIAYLLSSVNNNQEQLLREKQISGEAIDNFQSMILTLKKDIAEVERAINEIKTLS